MPQEDEDTSLIDFIESRPDTGSEDVSKALHDPELLVKKVDRKCLFLPRFRRVSPLFSITTCWGN